MLLLALVGWLYLRRQNRKLFLLTGLIISYFVLVSAGTETYSRIRVPIDPLYAITIAAGVEFVVKMLKRAKASPADSPYPM